MAFRSTISPYWGPTQFNLTPSSPAIRTPGLSSHQYVNANCFAAPTAPGENGPTLLPVSYGPGYFNSDLALFKNFKHHGVEKGSVPDSGL